MKVADLSAASLSALASWMVLAGCRGACGGTPPPPASSGGEGGASSAPSATAEMLPRCRADGASIAVPGDDVVVGEAVATSTALFVGVVRREGGRRVASVVTAPLDLRSIRAIDVGSSMGDDPPPALRAQGDAVFTSYFARKAVGDAGAPRFPLGYPGVTRELAVAKVGGTLEVLGAVSQHADESMAFDLAWARGVVAPLVAWDEDAPTKDAEAGAYRGVVKVEVLGGAGPRVVSPDTSDAESPRLLAQGDGFVLGWLARKPERGESLADASPSMEGPGEHRAFRWVELVTLDAKGEPRGPVRRASPEKGRALSFELVPGAAGGVDVLVQDEAAQAEGGGGRILRYASASERVEVADLVDGGVGHALAELVGTQDGGGPRWLAWTDVQDRQHLAPLGGALTLAAPPSTEPALEGARLLATGSGDLMFAASFGTGAVTLRRLVCR